MFRIARAILSPVASSCNNSGASSRPATRFTSPTFGTRTNILANQALTEDDYRFIRYFGSRLEGTTRGVEEAGSKTTIIADVHTDGNTRQVLEEGVGYVQTVAVAYQLPDGRVALGMGPALSYYEFKHPMADRLTDEAWRELLKTNPPAPPQWTSSFKVQ